MNILGLSFGYHDAAAALVQNGKVIAASDEERFSRKKHDPSFPKSAIDFCLEEAGLSIEEVDLIVYHESSLLKFDRIVRSHFGWKSWQLSRFKKIFMNWLRNNKFDPCAEIAAQLNCPVSKIKHGFHHQSHAASAFYCSPFEEAVVITLDGIGEWETTSISVGKGNSLKKLYSVNCPHSIGLFYSAVTAFLGFEVNEGEYRVMGMAGFGSPRFYDKLRALVTLQEDGCFEVNQEFFNFETPEHVSFRPTLASYLEVSPRSHGTQDISNDLSKETHNDLSVEGQIYADIAASLQKVTEEIVLHIAQHAIRRSGLKNICLAGGVALNGLANTRLMKELGCKVFVQPAAGDNGTAIGCALMESAKHLPKYVKSGFATPYLGASFSEGEIDHASKAAFLSPKKIFTSDDELCASVASLLKDGLVIGWFQGRAEWGPRALGNRSILANPTILNMQEKVNRAVKFREPFRPFAPSVVAEKAHEYFECPEQLPPLSPEEYMLAVHNVRQEYIEKLPTVTHVDGTARVHAVRKEIAPLFYNLLDEFEKLEGIPILMNTSFNLKGEPVVNSPKDAIKTYAWSEMDALVLGRHLFVK